MKANEVSHILAIRREAKFYRDQLELIAADSRRTRAQRLAFSALTFWDTLRGDRVLEASGRAADVPEQRPRRISDVIKAIV